MALVVLVGAAQLLKPQSANCCAFIQSIALALCVFLAHIHFPLVLRMETCQWVQQPRTAQASTGVHGLQESQRKELS